MLINERLDWCHHIGSTDPTSKLFERSKYSRVASLVKIQMRIFPVNLLLDKSRTCKWCCVPRNGMMLLSMLQSESISDLSWKWGTHPLNVTPTVKSAFMDSSTVSSTVRFLSQNKSNVPSSLFLDNIRVWSDGERFEDGLIGICPWRRLSDISKYLRCGSSNKEAGMVPVNWFPCRCNSHKFFKFLKAVTYTHFSY